MKIECKEDESVFEMRVCNAAHRLHKTHDSWEHNGSCHDPRECYQCHVFARIVLSEDAKL